MKFWRESRKRENTGRATKVGSYLRLGRSLLKERHRAPVSLASSTGKIVPEEILNHTYLYRDGPVSSRCLIALTISSISHIPFSSKGIIFRHWLKVSSSKNVQFFKVSFEKTMVETSIPPSSGAGKLSINSFSRSTCFLDVEISSFQQRSSLSKDCSLQCSCDYTSPAVETSRLLLPCNHQRVVGHCYGRQNWIVGSKYLETQITEVLPLLLSALFSGKILLSRCRGGAFSPLLLPIGQLLKTLAIFHHSRRDFRPFCMFSSPFLVLV